MAIAIFTARSFLMFLIYSFFGWGYETILCSVTQKSLVNRGFLNGPVCPIYGTGALLVIWFLKSFHNKPILLFLVSMLVVSLLEYIVSFLLEKLFHTRWWDYSHIRYNIQGRICLMGALVFGSMSLLLIEVVEPIVDSWIKMIPNTYLLFSAGIFFIIILSDIYITVKNIVAFNSGLAEIQLVLKNYREHSKQVTQQFMAALHEKIEKKFPQMARLSSGKWFQINRLMRAFPGMKPVKYADAFMKLQEYITSVRGLELKLPGRFKAGRQAEKSDVNEIVDGEEKEN